MSRSTGVLSAVQGAEELAFVTAVDALGPRVVVTRRCGDVAELLAAAHAGLGRVAVVSADLAGLDRDVVTTLGSAGITVIALADPPEGWLAERARALGVPVVVANEAAVDAVAAAAEQIEAGESPPVAEPPRHWTDAVGPTTLSSAETLEDLEATRPRPPAAGPPGASDPVPGAVANGADPGREPLVRADRPGALLAVWGPTGAPGRTTLAVNLAAELAALGPDEVLLADADTYGGTVAQSLGMLDEAPGIAAVARAAGQGVLDRAALALHAPVVQDGLRVLSGISRASRWPELGGPALDAVWDVARTVSGWTVVDCGFGLEDDEALSYDTRAPRRNAATLSALAAADLVVVVGAADPIGVQRLVRGLAELDEVAPPGTRVVVANRVRASAVGPRPGELVAAALERYAGVTELRLVPDDGPALDAAVLRGGALVEVAPGSPARKAIAGLAADLADSRARHLAALTGAAPTRQRRGRRVAARR